MRIERVDLLVANLFVEYIGVEEFAAFAAANSHSIGLLSCVTQHNDEEGFVSATELASSFDALASISSDIDVDELTFALAGAGFAASTSSDYELPNGEVLRRRDFAASAGHS